ncbi:MAG TPA: hypothetical protein VN634_18275 [Candidatus Limnocylindrales bacterium]|nr:hypothetical protein [Candidatus Limnocylindrales bacterium]
MNTHVRFLTPTQLPNARLAARFFNAGLAARFFDAGVAARFLNAGLAAGLLATVIASGCSTMGTGGRPAAPLTIKHDEPTIIECMSERTDSGGLRLIGKLDPGIYPITRATLEYRTAGPSDAPPTVPAPSGGLALASPRSEKVAYRKGADEIVFNVEGDAARSLRGKVLWYRWILEYGSSSNATDVYRTSLEEAGVPRSATTPGPDSSVALPSGRRR